MKKIKSIFESILAPLKQPELERVYERLRQELYIASQSKYQIWGLWAVYLGIGLSSVMWILLTIYQQFHYQDVLMDMQGTSQRTIHLGSNRLFSEPPPQHQPGFRIAYQLVGILFDEDVAKREVMLRLPSGEIKTYHINDELPDGVKILDIQAFQVKLEKNGQQKILKLDQYQSDFLSDKPKSGQTLF